MLEEEVQLAVADGATKKKIIANGQHALAAGYGQW
jgi:hypothetical protein